MCFNGLFGWYSGFLLHQFQFFYDVFLLFLIEQTKDLDMPRCFAATLEQCGLFFLETDDRNTKIDLIFQ